MSNLGSILLFFVASLIVFVESQEGQRCSESNECEEGCCLQSQCRTDKVLCLLLEKVKSKYERPCNTNRDCLGECCIDFKCKSTSIYGCVDNNWCTKNSDCDSFCCKDNKCQESSSVACLSFPTYRVPTLNFKNISDKCSASTDCYSSAEGCCVNGHCRACPQDSPNDHNNNNNNDDHGSPNDYNNNNNNDDYGSPNDHNNNNNNDDHGSSNNYNNNYNNDDYNGRSSSSSAGGVGVGVAFAISVAMSVVTWLIKRAVCNSRRERTVVDTRGRRTCVAVRVPIVENDELQREHERAEQEMTDCPQPAYTAETGEGNTQNAGQNQDPADEEGQANTSESYGVQQGPTMVPLVNLSSSYANQNENMNSTQPDFTQRAGMAGNIEEMNGVPQNPTMVPPGAYSPSPAANPNEKTTGQNSA